MRTSERPPTRVARHAAHPDPAGRRPQPSTVQPCRSDPASGESSQGERSRPWSLHVGVDRWPLSALCLWDAPRAGGGRCRCARWGLGPLRGGHARNRNFTAGDRVPAAVAAPGHALATPRAHTPHSPSLPSSSTNSQCDCSVRRPRMRPTGTAPLLPRPCALHLCVSCGWPHPPDRSRSSAAAAVRVDAAAPSRPRRGRGGRPPQMPQKGSTLAARSILSRQTTQCSARSVCRSKPQPKLETHALMSASMRRR